MSTNQLDLAKICKVTAIIGFVLAAALSLGLLFHHLNFDLNQNIIVIFTAISIISLFASLFLYVECAIKKSALLLFLSAVSQNIVFWFGLAELGVLSSKILTYTNSWYISWGLGSISFLLLASSFIMKTLRNNKF